MTVPFGAGLHILTSDEIVARPDFVSVAESLLDAMGPRGLLHLRTRQLPGARYVALTQRLARVARDAGSAVIVNARADVALAGEADGVQLGRGALSVADVRRLHSRSARHHTHFRVGVSIHTEGEAATCSDADWLIAGHVFETRSHPGERARGLAFVQQVSSAARCPVIAVGGVTPDTIRSLRDAGADGVAVLSGIWDADEPEKRVTHYLIQYGDWTGGGRLSPHG